MTRIAKWRIRAATRMLRGTKGGSVGFRPQTPPTASGGRPRHIAIIMDGNGRWATARGRSRIHGHEAGMRALWSVLDAALDEGVEYLSLFSFSTENWSRPRAEIVALMRLARESAQGFNDFIERGVRMLWCGSEAGLAPDVVQALREAEHRTRQGRATTVALCFNYGGRAEITRAAAELARAAVAGGLHPDAIDEHVFARHLLLPALPDVDMLIRTSGEQRISNFLLWQSAYSELFFVKTLWPDFTGDQLRALIHAFPARRRRFGAASAGVTAARHPGAVRPEQ